MSPHEIQSGLSGLVQQEQGRLAFPVLLFPASFPRDPATSVEFVEGVASFMFRRSSLRTKLAFLGLLVACVSLLVAGRVAAQTPFPPQSLLDASTLQQAVAVLGAAQAERSSHLLIDAPDVTGPGRYSLVIRSEIPGTSILVLLKTTLASPGMSATPSRTTTMLAERLVPGARATARLELEAETSQHLSLYAFARGRWFVATREVKLGRSVRAD